MGGPVPFPADCNVDYVTYVSYLGVLLEHPRSDFAIVCSLIEEKIDNLMSEVLDAGFNIQELCFWIAINRECLKGGTPSLLTIKRDAEAMIQEVALRYQQEHDDDESFDDEENKEVLQGIVMREVHLLMDDLRAFIRSVVLESSM